MTSRPSALCAGVTIDTFGCVITLGLLIWPQMLVEGGTASHSCHARRLRRLLIVTDIGVDESRPRVPLRWLRQYGGLERHFDVAWLVAGGNINEGDQPIPGEVRLVFVPAARSKWHLLALWPRYVKILTDAMRRTDIVFVRGPTPSAVPALVAARLRRQPSVLWVVAPTQVLPWFRRRSNRWMVPLVDNLQVLLATETLLIDSHLGDGIFSPLRRRLGVLRSSPIGEEDFLPIEEPPSGIVGLLCVGRLWSRKRFDIAIETLALLRRDGIEATLTIVGDGEERPRLERLTNELGLSNAVDFVGWLEDPASLREHYRRAFALLLPSEFEGFGVVVLEAMAAGTPVVRTAPTSGYDVLEPDVDVLIVPTGSAESFARAVMRLHTDRGLYLQIARAAQSKAWSLTREAWQRSFCERADRLIRGGHQGVVRRR